MATAQANGEIRSIARESNGGTAIVSGQNEMTISDVFKWALTGETVAVKAKEKKLAKTMDAVLAQIQE